MKKQVGIIGLVFMLVCIGLSGCTNIGLTNIGDISANPDNFLNKKVTIEGLCMGSLIPGVSFGYGQIVDDSSHSIYYKYQNILNGHYRLVGTIKQGVVVLVNVTYIDVETATGT